LHKIILFFERGLLSVSFARHTGVWMATT